MRRTHAFIVVYVTFPNLKVAKRIVNSLIKSKIIACGNIFRLSSLYIWKGKIEQEKEYGAFLKTTKKNYKKAENFIKNNHPYEVPEIISWTIERGSEAYLTWVEAETHT